MDTSEHPWFEVLIRAIGGAGLGMAFGVLLLGFSLFHAAVVRLSGTPVDMTGFWPGAIIYVFGFTVGGALMGALWPVRPSPWRQYVAGIAGGVAVMARAARIVEGPVATWGHGAYIAIAVVGALFGAAIIRVHRSWPLA
jgi:hypothetical protein